MNSILVIEDDDDVRQLIAYKLERLGLEVHTEADGEAGLATALRVQPDLVILDWMMPKATGLEVCQRLRASETLSHVPVILLTARAQEADLQRGFEAGADDYIVKPFSTRELASRTAAALARGRAAGD